MSTRNSSLCFQRVKLLAALWSIQRVLLVWDSVSPHRGSSAVRSGTFRSWRQETESVCSLTISMGIHVVQLTFTSNLKSRWVWVLLLSSDNFTLPTTDLVYWWEQVLRAKEGEYEEFYSFSLCCLADQCHFKWIAPKLYPFLQRCSSNIERLWN